MHINYFYLLGDPQTDPNAATDAFKTLFIGRLVSVVRGSSCIKNCKQMLV